MTTSSAVSPGAIGIGISNADENLAGFPKKIFARPFRLVFTRHPQEEDDTQKDSYVTWIEVKSLSGLENVAKRVSTGELTPVNAWATLDRQLWGLLAEHSGFLRYDGPTSEGSAGIQPLGVEQGQLHDDMTELFGGFEPAIAALSEMRNQIVEDLEKTLPTDESNNSELLKDDGVNLTPAGEEIIAKEVYGEDGIKLIMETANAESLTLDTDISDSPVGDAIAEFDASVKELQTVTGDEAAEQGRLVERAAEGDLEDEEEID
ncbi:MAG: hypothetical protein ACXABY_26120 [Candidatus Thorarchaeota archaeon]|jgi:hypothetical protein